MVTSTEVIWLLNEYKSQHVDALREAGEDEDCGGIDVRLCLWEDGQMAIFCGPVDYDPVHAPVCAAGVLCADTDTSELASELISEAQGQLAILDA